MQVHINALFGLVLMTAIRRLVLIVAVGQTRNGLRRLLDLVLSIHFARVQRERLLLFGVKNADSLTACSSVLLVLRLYDATASAGHVEEVFQHGVVVHLNFLLVGLWRVNVVDLVVIVEADTLEPVAIHAVDGHACHVATSLSLLFLKLLLLFNARCFHNTDLEFVRAVRIFVK